MSHFETEAHKIAAAFVSARRAAHGLSEYPGAPPSILAEAYAIQDAAIPLFGGEIAGWKVGRINPPWFDQLGVSRLSGPIFADSILAAVAGENPTGLVFDQGFGAAEAEFVFRIARAPAPGQTKFTIDDAVDLIDAVFCGIEIASSPFSGINGMGPLVTISDFGNNNGLLIGPEIANWATSALDNWDLTTLIDGEVVGSGKAAAFPGGPLESVRFLIENLVERGLPITPGLLVSSGAVTGVHEVRAGQLVMARFGTYCDIECAIGHQIA